MSETLKRRGAVDGGINAAGVVAFGRLGETSPSVPRTLFDINAIGPLQLVQAALPHMAEGFVINISAVVVEQPMARLVAYCASKAALSVESKALGLELKLKGGKIRVIDAWPPHTETGLAQRPIAGEAPTGSRP